MVPIPPHPEGWQPSDGSVLLLDEIDKADTDLANGLLETLGNNDFPVPYAQTSVRQAADSPAPLVIITTNEEREPRQPFCVAAWCCTSVYRKTRQTCWRGYAGAAWCTFRISAATRYASMRRACYCATVSMPATRACRHSGRQNISICCALCAP